jgi:hypothetical protein
VPDLADCGNPGSSTEDSCGYPGRCHWHI